MAQWVITDESCNINFKQNGVSHRTLPKELMVLEIVPVGNSLNDTTVDCVFVRYEGKYAMELPWNDTTIGVTGYASAELLRQALLALGNSNPCAGGGGGGGGEDLDATLSIGNITTQTAVFDDGADGGVLISPTLIQVNTVDDHTLQITSAGISLSDNSGSNIQCYFNTALGIYTTTSDTGAVAALRPSGDGYFYDGDSQEIILSISEAVPSITVSTTEQKIVITSTSIDDGGMDGGIDMSTIGGELKLPATILIGDTSYSGNGINVPSGTSFEIRTSGLSLTTVVSPTGTITLSRATGWQNTNGTLNRAQVGNASTQASINQALFALINDLYTKGYIGT